jgi:hypothetical protein
MGPRIVFLVMSAVQAPETVDQLARALGRHRVLVHHDFSQTPAFRLDAPNVRFVPEPRRTGWAYFGFTDGIFHSLRYATEHLEFDYLQLLSPTCLPIKPIAAFEAAVSGEADAHFGCVDLLADPDALMSVGYRAFTPEHSLRHRAARWLSRRYFGAASGRRDVAGIWLRTGFDAQRDGDMTWPAKVALATIRALAHPAIGRHVFGPGLRPYYGSTWFGARRGVVARMVEEFRRPGIRDYFSRLRIADEFLIPTILMRICTRPGPMNHYIHTFEEARTGVLADGDFETLRTSPAFFARRFADDARAPLRIRVLRELAGTEAAVPPVPNEAAVAPPVPNEAAVAPPVPLDAAVTPSARHRADPRTPAQSQPDPSSTV